MEETVEQKKTPSWYKALGSLVLLVGILVAIIAIVASMARGAWELGKFFFNIW
jgi:hypothetical protein